MNEIGIKKEEVMKIKGRNVWKREYFIEIGSNMVYSDSDHVVKVHMMQSSRKIKLQKN